MHHEDFVQSAEQDWAAPGLQGSESEWVPAEKKKKILMLLKGELCV